MAVLGAGTGLQLVPGTPGEADRNQMGHQASHGFGGPHLVVELQPQQVLHLQLRRVIDNVLIVLEAGGDWFLLVVLHLAWTVGRAVMERAEPGPTIPP